MVIFLKGKFGVGQSIQGCIQLERLCTRQWSTTLNSLHDVGDEWMMWKLTDLCVAHVIAFVEADAARPAAAAAATVADGRCIERIQVVQVEVVAVARPPAPQWRWSSYGSSVFQRCQKDKVKIGWLFTTCPHHQYTYVHTFRVVHI